MVRSDLQHPAPRQDGAQLALGTGGSSRVPERRFPAAPVRRGDAQSNGGGLTVTSISRSSLGRRAAAHLLTRDEARIATNITQTFLALSFRTR